MKFISTLTLALSTVTSVVALARDPAVVAAATNRKGLETRDPTSFENGTFSKRQCDYNTPCRCNFLQPGLFCGDDAFGCVKGHVYQCNEDGVTTCDFGIRDSCVACNQLSCP